MSVTRVDFGPGGQATQVTPGAFNPTTSNLASPEQITGKALDTATTRMAWDGHRDVMIDHRPQSINMADVGNGASGILGTAQSSSGSPRAVSGLRPTDTVDVGGTRTTVEVAERLGLLRLDNATGLYSEGGSRGNVDSASADLNKATERANSNNNNEQTETTATDHDQDQRLTAVGAEDTISELVKATSPGTQVRAMGQLITTGEVDPHTLTALASEAGIHPDDLSAKIGTITAGFQEQADKVATSVGVHDVDDFYAWAKTSKAADLRKAMTDQAMSRNTGGYRALANEYVASLDMRDPEAILGATFGNGITAKKAADGRVVVSVPGRGEVSWRSAVKSGLVKVSRNR